VGRSTRSVAAALLLCSTLVAAEQRPDPVPPDPMPAVLVVLPSPPSVHWVWINDMVFGHMSDGQARLVDGDTGRFLGMLNTGFGFARLVLPRDGKLIYAPETYFARGTRGERTDVVSIYDAAHLAPVAEIVVPPKRSSNMPMMANAVLTDDDRFLLIYNFNPGQSVTVVDMQRREFVGEVETAGCALVYPTGPRSFFSICGDGALLDVRLDEQGHAASRTRTGVLFDVRRDPVTEKAVRDGDTWQFVSFEGEIYPVKFAPQGLVLEKRWSLLTAEDKAQAWRPGGLQQLAIHVATRRLYSIMHQGPVYTHKDPGPEIWVYDLEKKVRVQRIVTANITSSIQVTPDAKPLLFGAFLDSPTLDVYDALSGQPLRSVDTGATTATVLVTPGQ
jgi:methylamine dehydrogenase heavy chain